MFAEDEFQAYIHSQLADASILHSAMKYSLLSGGKRIRPSFTLESAAIAALPLNVAKPCAFAIEIAHCFSLVHDDLPSMDNDDFRRGMPTTHRKFDDAQALLAGDALLNFAHKTFLKCLNYSQPQAFSRAFQFFISAIGDQGMIKGQSDELISPLDNLDELYRIQALKTGALFEASILCPLLLAGLSEQDQLYQDCLEYAKNFGFAFQIADDLTDETQDQQQGSKNILSLLGRKAAIDLAVKKLTSSSVAQKFSATSLLLAQLK